MQPQIVEETHATTGPEAGKAARVRLSRPVLQLLVGLSGVVFLALLVFFGRYLVNPRPIEELIHPELGLDVPPHYLGPLFGLDRPVGVAVSPDGGQIYVSESGSERLVRVFNRRGRQISAWAPGSGLPSERSPVYLAVDGSGSVLVSDRRHHLIAIYNAEGRLQGEYQPGWSPLGLQFTPDGSLLVTAISAGRHSVRQFSLIPASEAPTLVESGPSCGKSGDGPGNLSFQTGAVRDALGALRSGRQQLAHRRLGCRGTLFVSFRRRSRAKNR